LKAHYYLIYTKYFRIFFCTAVFHQMLTRFRMDDSTFEQFDERDNVFARRDLVPGTPEYEDMYRRHPEWKQLDDENRSRREIGTYTSAADMGMVEAPFWLLRKLGEPGCVDGEPAERPVTISPERATLKVKTFAKRLGADLVGISRMNPAFAYSHRGRLTYPQESWGSPITVLHKFAISMGFREDVELIRTAPGSPEMLETARGYLVSATVAIILAQYIRSLGYPARAHHFRNYQVLSVPLAIEAGLGELGRCGFLMAKECGNCLRLSTVTTDLPLLTDEPIDIGVQDFCRRCKLCAEACPSDAIPMEGKTHVRGVEKWHIDDIKCHHYWTKVGTDCGMCIASCPWSQPDTLLHRTSASWASRSQIGRIILLWLHPIIYGKYKPRKAPEWLDQKVSSSNRQGKSSDPQY
jgi:ferredoxin